MTTAQLPGPIVDADWLAEHLADVAVVDSRWYLDGRSGAEAHLAGHVPGAVFVDLDRALAGTAGTAVGRHPLPDPADFARALGELGIGDDRPVVVYDDVGGSVAARLWWLLHSLDEPVAVLDGGLAAWHGPLETGPVRPSPAVRQPRSWPIERFVDIPDVAAAIDDPSVLLIDARTSDRYAAGNPAVDPRPGHVPGARSAPWADNLDPATGRFLADDALRARYHQLGVNQVDRVVAYCGSGVTACHDLLALTLTGATDLALFVGSWSAWGADHQLPNETGADSRLSTGG